MAKVEGLGTAQKKKWAWSYSKLKNYDTCPKRHYEVDLQKNFTDSSEQLDWGNQVHKVLAFACEGKQELPETMATYQKWVDAIRSGPGTLLVEQKYAITEDFAPCKYFAPDAWYRGIGDVVRLDGPVGLVVDWKTGKVLEDSVQLMLMAQCLFSTYPQLQRVRSEFIWLKHDCTTPEVFTRQEIADAWVTLLPRVQAMKAANDTMNYPPKPGFLCKSYCPVVSCPFHGKGAR